MATGGAWQSQTFDNGRDFQKPAQQPYVTQETPPPMYNAPVSSTQAADRGVFGVLALALRVAQVVLTLIAFTIMASNRQYYYYYHYDVKFSNVKAFTGLVAVNCIVCFYAIVQLVHSFVNYSTQASFVSSATTGFALITSSSTWFWHLL